MSPRLRLYDYVSRAKVAQLYDQLHPFTVSEQSVRREKKGGASVETRAGISGLFTGGVRGDANLGASVEQRGSVTTVQKLAEVLAHIEKHESVGDLNKIMTAENMRLDAFCYSYRGEFAVLGVLPRRPGRWYGRPGVYDSSAILINTIVPSEVFVSTESGETVPLVLTDEFQRPARLENSFEEVGEDGRYLVSDICILGSRAGDRFLQLACSFKYFNWMMNEGWEGEDECYFMPDSSSAFFFQGDHTFSYEGMIFVTGVDEDTTVMGTPLMLSH